MKSLLVPFNNIRNLVLENYTHNDIAHRIDHADTVAEEAVKICVSLKLPKDVFALSVIAAYLHDVQCHVDRKHHHVLAHSWTYRNAKRIMSECPLVESIKDIEAIANACYEHRSSYKGAYSSVVSEVVAAADNGAPECDLSLYRRSYMYCRATANGSKQEAIMHALTHIKDKYGVKGYSKYSPVYIKMYDDALVNRMNWIELVSEEEIAEQAEVWERELCAKQLAHN